jgi:hypothetical protein
MEHSCIFRSQTRALRDDRDGREFEKKKLYCVRPIARGFHLWMSMHGSWCAHAPPWSSRARPGSTTCRRWVWVRGKLCSGEGHDVLASTRYRSRES